MEIRQAALSDLLGLSELFDKYRQFYRQQPDKKGASAFIRERLSRKDSIILLAVDEQSTIGFVQLYPVFSSVAMQRIFILNDLFVSPSIRKKGVATALLRKAETVALKAGAARLTLATEKTNGSAQSLYEKLHWQKDHTFSYYEKNLDS